jgi:hypothetical protein
MNRFILKHLINKVKKVELIKLVLKMLISEILKKSYLNIKMIINKNN